MKAIQYKTSRRTRRETFPDGSQLFHRPGGGYEIIEARPKYGLGTAKAPTTRRPRAKQSK